MKKIKLKKCAVYTILFGSMVANFSLFRSFADVSISKFSMSGESVQFQQDEEKLCDKFGNEISDFITYCYINVGKDEFGNELDKNDEKNDDWLGKISFSIYARKNAENGSSNAKVDNGENKDTKDGNSSSVFLNRDVVRVEFVNEKGECKFTTRAVCERHDDSDKFHVNLFSVNKFELPFGQKYTIKFYDVDAESNDENLLATYKINIQKPKKAEDEKLCDKFGNEISDFITYCYINVGKDEFGNELDKNDEKNDDWLGKISFSIYARKNAGNGNSNAKVDNGENKDTKDGSSSSVFLNRDVVRVEFVNEKGECKFITRAVCERHDDSDEFHVNLFSVNKFELPFGQKYTMKFYDVDAESNDENLLATYKIDIQKPEKGGGLS